MSSIWLAAAAIVGGIVALVWSADRFVAGSAAIAHRLGVSRLIIGLTIVSLGTSLPEILVSINASLVGSGDMAVGNALGSNIANIGLVLAITALLAPLPIHKHLLLQEVPVLLAVTALAGIFLYDHKLQFWEGSVLISLIAPLVVTMLYVKKKHPTEEEFGADIPDLQIGTAIIWFVVGLMVLIVSADILVWAAKEVALFFGVSTLVIGLTVIALGTSLPELAASVMSALKGHHDIALGNIIGSNIFNILAVMSIPGLVTTLKIEPVSFYRDYMVMAGLTILLCAALIIDFRLKGLRKHGHLGKLIGSILLIAYFGYYAVIFITV